SETCILIRKENHDTRRNIVRDKSHNKTLVHSIGIVAEIANAMTSAGHKRRRGILCCWNCLARTDTNTQDSRLVMPALVAGIHVLKTEQDQRRGWRGQARP